MRVIVGGDVEFRRGTGRTCDVALVPKGGMRALISLAIFTPFDILQYLSLPIHLEYPG
jgi:hypothetical protein